MHPKYWKPARLMAPFEGEGATGGGESLADAFASHFEAPAPDDKQAAAPAAPDADAARIAAEDAALRASQEQNEPAQPQEGQPPAAAQEPQKFTVNVDGKPLELTETELAEHVKNGMRQSDYTQKTMALAEQRKAAETETAQARAQREELAGKLTQFSNYANYEVNTLASQLTQELLATDPVQYLSIQRTVQERQAQLQQAHGELQKIEALRSQEKAEAARLDAEDQHAKLLAKIPEWSDPAKAQAGLTQLQDYLSKEGYDHQGDGLPKHLQISMARKAMMYDALMARTATTQATVTKAPPKVERPGTPVSATDGRTTATRRFEQTGSREDAAAMFAEKYA